MKARTKCPQCHKEFVLDAPEGKTEHEAKCPFCSHKFIIRPTCDPNTNPDDCYWEEHGEPRKTILSSNKQKTKMPTVAGILLICVFVLGISSAVFANAFLDTPLSLLAENGFLGSVDIIIVDQNNDTLSNVTIVVENAENINFSKDRYHICNAPVGINKIELSLDNYTTYTKEILILPLITSTHNFTMSQGEGQYSENFDTVGCFIILLIFSVIGLLAAVMCLKRHHLDVAIVGGILAIFSFGFFFLGSVLSIVAFVLIVRSRDEFENGTKGKIF